MKENLRKLNLCIKLGIFNPNDYYLITVHSYEIVFQGKYSSALVNNLRSKKMECIVNVNGYIDFRRNDIRITLTD